jgi:hypothetical protein
MSKWVCKTCDDIIPHEHYPTTEGVRRAYVYPSPSGAVWDEQDAEVEFNLWLKYHDEDVAKDTEERIIKRLEEEREKHIPWCGEVQPCPKCYQTIGLETAIALTEGENK